MNRALGLVFLTVALLAGVGGATAFLNARLTALDDRLARLEQSADARAQDRDRSVDRIFLTTDTQAKALNKQTAALAELQSSLDASTAELSTARKQQEETDRKLDELAKAFADRPVADQEKLAKLLTELEKLNTTFREVVRFARGY